jgi:hypothetical protein
MPYSNNPYCARADVKTALDLTGTAKDTWIDELITEAQAEIDQILGYKWQFTTVPETHYFDGRCDRDTLIVGDIVSFSQVLENGIDITAMCQLAPYSADTKYKLVKTSSTAGSTVSAGVEFTEGRRNIAVTGVWGRNSSIPLWLKRITIRLVVHWVKMQATNYSDMMTDQAGVKQRYMKRIPDDVREVLNNKSRIYFRSLR